MAGMQSNSVSWVVIGVLEKVGLEPAMLAGSLLDILNSFAKYNLDIGRYNKSTASVAQWLSRPTCNDGVPGSNRGSGRCILSISIVAKKHEK